MAEWAPRVFWSEVEVVTRPGGYSVTLDGRPVRTPAKRPLDMPTRAMAEAVAAEWEAQEETIDPLSMPATRAANAAIDKIVPQKAEVASLIAAYGETDLLCYRAEGPRDLLERQRLAWDPLLEWSERVLGAPLVTVNGVMPQPQPAGSLRRLAEEVAARHAFELAGLHDLVGFTGSLVLGLAVDHREIAPETAWDLARVDEIFQQEQWGVDPEAKELERSRRRAFLAAHRFCELAR